MSWNPAWEITSPTTVFMKDRLTQKEKEETVMLFGVKIPKYKIPNGVKCRFVMYEGYRPVKVVPVSSRKSFSVASIRGKVNGVITKDGRDYFIDKKGDILEERKERPVELGTPDYTI